MAETPRRKTWLLWRRGENSLRWSGGPAVKGDLFVVGSLDGDVYALSAQDGSERWHVKASSEVISRPAISDQVVVVRTIDGRLAGLDANDGSRKWVFDQPVPPLSLRGNSSPIIVGDTVYDGYDNGKVVAVRLADGNPPGRKRFRPARAAPKSSAWPTSMASSCRPAAIWLRVGYRGQVAAIAVPKAAGRYGARHIELQWRGRRRTHDRAGRCRRQRLGIDARHGRGLWKQDRLKYRWLGTPAVQGKYVVIGDREGFVHWLEPDEGKFVARERLSKKPIETRAGRHRRHGLCRGRRRTHRCVRGALKRCV